MSRWSPVGVEHDDMIETLASHGSDEPFDVRVRRSTENRLYRGDDAIVRAWIAQPDVESERGAPCLVGDLILAQHSARLLRVDFWRRRLLR